MTRNQSQIGVILAAHGIPATNYPPMRVGLLMMLHFAGGLVSRTGFLRAYHDSLDDQIRQWPRTADNDPYKVAIDDLAAKLSTRLGCRVVAAYNEFCAPTIAEAIGQVVADGVQQVIVLPTMLVRGNDHTEREIREAVAQASERYPDADIHYAWPFDQERLVSLLADQAVAHSKLER